MFEEIIVKRLSVGTVFKLIGIGSVISMGIFGIAMGVLAFFGANTVNIDGVNIYGGKALIIGPIIGIVVAIFATLFLGATISTGLWIYSKFSLLKIVSKS